MSCQIVFETVSMHHFLLFTVLHRVLASIKVKNWNCCQGSSVSTVVIQLTGNQPFDFPAHRVQWL